MEKKTLRDLFSQKLFRIPDYQRGYAWETDQWKDFVEDIDALVNEDVKNHYTGTLVTYEPRNAPAMAYGTTDKLDVVDVVDGQQRLTTSCLYLSIIIRKLVQLGQRDYEQKMPHYLYSGATCKLTLNNDTEHFFFDLLRNGHANVLPTSTHQKRLRDGYAYFQNHIETQLRARGAGGLEYLQSLFDAITRKLVFTYYTIEEECEIGMTFELMNSRGKELSALELLKNYLMHWVSRNAHDLDRPTMTSLINKNWRDTYVNIGTCGGDETQCLRVAWTLLCNHTPKNWIGYKGFKQDYYIPLRSFKTKSKADTKQFIEQFADGLAEISRHFSALMAPSEENTPIKEERVWIQKIIHTDNTANFVPLLVASRMSREKGAVADTQYIDLLKSIERYAYRVFLYEGKRSNAGKSAFHTWASEVMDGTKGLPQVTAEIDGLTIYYVGEASFEKDVREPFEWYGYWLLLRYTLFEYELHLLGSEGKDKKPALEWDNLRDSTIEHILPQNPKSDSQWLKKWGAEDIKRYRHDLGNLVLTQNNSNYKNFEFDRKKGSPGVSPSYANSDIRQERKLSSVADWTVTELLARREELANWIITRWSVPQSTVQLPLQVDEQDDEDGVIAPAPGEEVALDVD